MNNYKREFVNHYSCPETVKVRSGVEERSRLRRVFTVCQRMKGARLVCNTNTTINITINTTINITINTTTNTTTTANTSTNRWRRTWSVRCAMNSPGRPSTSVQRDISFAQVTPPCFFSFPGPLKCLQLFLLSTSLQATTEGVPTVRHKIHRPPNQVEPKKKKKES